MIERYHWFRNEGLQLSVVYLESMRIYDSWAISRVVLPKN